MDKKINTAHRYVSHLKVKMAVFCLLLLAAGSAQAAFNPLVMIQNLGGLLQSIETLLGMIFSFLGFLLTGFGLYTAIQILRGAQSVQRMENPWAYVIGAVIIGPILMFVGVVITGMWEAITEPGSSSGSWNINDFSSIIEFMVSSGIV